METITWKNSNASGKQYDVEIGNQLYGTLSIRNLLRVFALFQQADTKIKFEQQGRAVALSKNDKPIGRMASKLLSPISIQLSSGRTFQLSSNLFGGNLKWLDQQDQSVVEYSFARLNSMRKGNIQVIGPIESDEKDVLVIGGLIAGWISFYRLILMLPSLGIIGFLVSRFT